jgi:hypothetical protein
MLSASWQQPIPRVISLRHFYLGMQHTIFWWRHGESRSPVQPMPQQPTITHSLDRTGPTSRWMTMMTPTRLSRLDQLPIREGTDTDDHHLHHRIGPPTRLTGMRLARTWTASRLLARVGVDSRGLLRRRSPKVCATPVVFSTVSTHFHIFNSNCTHYTTRRWQS